jgi:hypothetical protein
MRITAATPAVRRPAPVVRAAVMPETTQQAPAPKAPVKAQAGGKSGFFGLVKALFLNGFGSVSGLLSIGNDMKEVRTDAPSKTAHVVEVAGDVLNILSWPAAFIPGYGRAIAGGLTLLGLATKTTGEMMAGKD